MQFATLLSSLVILGVFVTHIGSDCAQGPPMMQQVQETYGQTPKAAYVDGNYSTAQNIEGLADLGITRYSPVKQPKKDLAQRIDPHAPKRRDTPVIEEWRGRMKTDEAKATYRQRSKCELPNAWCRNRGLSPFVVRGSEKATEEAKWYVLADNLERLASLRCEGEGTGALTPRGALRARRRQVRKPQRGEDCAPPEKPQARKPERTKPPKKSQPRSQRIDR